MGNVEKWLAVISVALFAMFAGEMISVYYFMLTVPEDAVVAQGFTPDPKLIQFVSIGVAPAGILAAVAYIMSRNYGSKQIGGLIIVGGIILLAGNLVVYSWVDSVPEIYQTIVEIAAKQHAPHTRLGFNAGPIHHSQCVLETTFSPARNHQNQKN